MKHDDTHINEKVVAIKDIARLVYLVEHRASFTDFKAFLLKEKLASYEDGVRKASRLAGHIVKTHTAQK